MLMPEKLYTTGEVAKIFGVSYVAVKKWAYSGKIKYIRTPGGKYRYPMSEIRRLNSCSYEFRWKNLWSGKS